MENTRTMTPEEIIRHIDFKELKEQKATLVDMQYDFLNQDLPLSDKHVKYIDTIEGMLNFIDLVQDCAVDELGYNEYDVFNLTNNDI